MTAIIIIAIVVIIAIIIGVTYNGLVKSRMQTQESFAQIDVQLKRRNDLIPNLLETVKGYSKFEQETLSKVIGLRNGIAHETDISKKMAMSDKLEQHLSGIFAVAESYPDLKANQQYLELQEELTNTENKIGYSRQLYNTTVSRYNTKLQTFPTNIIAGMFHFQQADFLKTPESEKEVVKVKF